ncbi:AP-1 complex subunit [Hortaea werneckii]|nr:AP-1 complex subunit [Hortaea werneckii]
MASALFFLDLKGKTLLARNYRGDIPLSAVERFPTLLSEIEEETSSAPPCLTADGINYLYIRHNNLYLLALTKRNSNAAELLLFLHKIVEVFTEYFKELEEESIRDNFVVIYELLDEMMDFGYPQTTEHKILQEYITQESHKLEVQARPPIAVTNAVSWRSEGIRYRKNEVFLDVVESLNLLVSSSGNVLRSEILGAIKMKCYLSGMPELRLGLNDKVMFETTGRATRGKSVEMEDVKFHQCVRLSRFENDRTISFIPPDGEFELMSYRLNTQVKPLIWVECVVENHSGSRVEYMLKAKAQFKRRSTANNVEIHVPVPEDADTPRFRTNIGSVHYAPESSEIVWKIKQFGGGKEFLMRAELGLPSVRGDEERGGGMMGGFGGSMGGIANAGKSKRPINVKFEIPYFTTSGIQVRYLKIIEPKLQYPSLPWCQKLYSCHSGFIDSKHQLKAEGTMSVKSLLYDVHHLAFETRLAIGSVQSSNRRLAKLEELVNLEVQIQKCVTLAGNTSASLYTLRTDENEGYDDLGGAEAGWRDMALALHEAFSETKSFKDAVKGVSTDVWCDKSKLLASLQDQRQKLGRLAEALQQQCDATSYQMQAYFSSRAASVRDTSEEQHLPRTSQLTGVDRLRLLDLLGQDGDIYPNLVDFSHHIDTLDAVLAPAPKHGSPMGPSIRCVQNSESPEKGAVEINPSAADSACSHTSVNASGMTQYEKDLVSWFKHGKDQDVRLRDQSNDAYLAKLIFLGTGAATDASDLTLPLSQSAHLHLLGVLNQPLALLSALSHPLPCINLWKADSGRFRRGLVFRAPVSTPAVNENWSLSLSWDTKRREIRGLIVGFQKDDYNWMQQHLTSVFSSQHALLLPLKAVEAVLVRDARELREHGKKLFELETLTRYQPYGGPGKAAAHKDTYYESSTRTLSRIVHRLSFIAMRLEQFQVAIDAMEASSYDVECSDEGQCHFVAELTRLRVDTKSAAKLTSYHQKMARDLMDILFSMVSQIDNNVSRTQNEESVKLTQASVTIASTSKADSSAMKALAVLSTFFLPGTFISALFSMTMFDWRAPDGQPIVSDHFWVYWALTIPITLTILLALLCWWWYFVPSSEEACHRNVFTQVIHRSGIKASHLWQTVVDVLVAQKSTVRESRFVLLTPAQ